MTAPVIQRFLDENLHRFDLPAQYLGTEPNAVRKSWCEAAVRWCLVASWPYEQAAGNSSIPAVYKAVNAHHDYLADRFYLPATPRDLRLIERAGVPIFGIESKQPLRAFDVVGTSISYPVLSMSWVKMLTVSGIPARWRDRDPNAHPMVIAGGLSYGAPEVLAPVVDCWWLGEVEDEPGNPGLGDVCARIAGFKHSGAWTRDRVACYEALAREFNFLYFPRFVRVHYSYEDRTHVGVGPRPSKQVAGYTSTIEGMRMPFTKRHVRDLDAVPPLDDPPLLYSDPGMGAGDLEVGRGCPAWCSFCALCLAGDTEFITRKGVRCLDECVGETVEVWNHNGWQTATVDQHGVDWLDEITFAPAFWDSRRQSWIRSRSSRRITHRATALHRWPLIGGGETHHLKVGDLVQPNFVTEDQGDFDLGWVHGLTFGDGTRENIRSGDRSNAYAVLVRADQPGTDDMLGRLEAVRCDRLWAHSGCGRPTCVVSVTRVKPNLYRVRMNSRTRLKEFPTSDMFSASYIAGFIDGWDAADGSSKNRSITRRRIFTQNPDAGAWFEKHAAYGGWALTGVYRKKFGEVTNYGPRKNPMWEFGLSRIVAWQVVSVEKEVIKDGVYCATVEGDGFFTLASGILTGNTYRQKRRSHSVNAP